MIGVDTNVLVRYLMQDDEIQARTANAFFARAADRGETFHLNDIVLCELVWVLRASYRVNRVTIAMTIEGILDTTSFSFDDRDRLRRALAEYRGGSGDFADYLIGLRNLAAGCDRTVTFDRSLHDSRSFAAV